MRTASFSFTTLLSSTRAFGGGAGGDGATTGCSFFLPLPPLSCDFFSVSDTAISDGAPSPNDDPPPSDVPPIFGGTGARCARAAFPPPTPPSPFVERSGASVTGAPDTPVPPEDSSSKAGVMSAACATRSTLGITRRGNAASSSGTFGSSIAMISCLGFHSAAATGVGSGGASTRGAASETGFGISGTTVFAVASASRSTRSSGFSASGAGGGGGGGISVSNGSLAIFSTCITGMSFVQRLSLFTDSGNGANAQSASPIINPTWATADKRIATMISAFRPSSTPADTLSKSGFILLVPEKFVLFYQKKAHRAM